MCGEIEDLAPVAVAEPLRLFDRFFAARCMTSSTSRLRPEPTATHVSGDSASCAGICVSWRSRSSRPDEERASAGEDDAAVHDVGRELGRRLVERRADRVQDLADRLLERVADLVAS